MNVRQTRRLVTFIAVVILALIAYLIVRPLINYSPKPSVSPTVKPAVGPAKRLSHSVPPADNRIAAAGEPTTRTAATRPLAQPASGPILPTPTAQDKDKASELLNLGLAQFDKGELLAARGNLADALWSGGLNDQQAETARQRLTELADKMLFSRQIFADDPCQLLYAVKTGDTLAAVERKLKLRVPTQLIVRINELASASALRAGENIKLIRGPFHAIVSKSKLTMDVYLREDNGRMTFVRRFPVGTGKNGSTPPGRWRVALGGKIVHAAWTPPSSSDLPRRRILPGEPDYALGKRGIWISLEGVDGNPYTSEDGYGIHDTNDQDSVGQNSSLGCIRMRDEDIDLVFSLLYEYWSTVTVLD